MFEEGGEVMLYTWLLRIVMVRIMGLRIYEEDIVTSKWVRYILGPISMWAAAFSFLMLNCMGVVIWFIWTGNMLSDYRVHAPRLFTYTFALVIDFIILRAVGHVVTLEQSDDPSWDH